MTTRKRSDEGLHERLGDRRSWELAAERGPDWLFVRLAEGDAEPGDKVDLAEAIWDMIREHHANRVVLELDRIDSIDEPLIGAIAEIGSRVRQEGGLIRACGLSQTDCERLEKASESGVPHFGSRSEAVSPRGWCVGSCE
jgi:MFS superfamily sulfate permease-like transporter